MNAGTDTFTVGQRTPLGGLYYVFQTYLSFDTSAVTGTVSSVTLSIYGQFDNSVTDFTIEARVHDFGATLETGDYVAGASLSGKTLVASRSTASGWSTSGYNAFTSDAAFLTAINQSGSTRLLLCSDRTRSGTTPTTFEMVNGYTAEATDPNTRPKLVVVTT